MIDINQSWTSSILTPEGLVTSIESSEREFYNGEYSGSVIGCELSHSIFADAYLNNVSSLWMNEIGNKEIKVDLPKKQKFTKEYLPKCRDFIESTSKDDKYISNEYLIQSTDRLTYRITDFCYGAMLCSRPEINESLSTDEKAKAKAYSLKIVEIKKQLNNEPLINLENYLNNLNYAWDEGIEVVQTNQDVKELDTLLRAKWNKMVTYFKQNEKDKALQLIYVDDRPLHKELFDAAGKNMALLAYTYIDFQPQKFYKDYAIYELVTYEKGKTYAYEVVFVRDGNNIWWIHEF